jgi:CDGSH-type Zn-finger protein
VRIKAEDDPIEVKGAVDLIDSDGQASRDHDPVYLCRCGQSAEGRSVTSSHKKAGFKG